MIPHKKNIPLTRYMVIFGVFSLLFNSCQKEEKLSIALDNPQLPTLRIKAENDTDRMLEDGESLSEMTNENRRFKVSEILRLRAIGKDSLEIANFAPVNITDVIITMKNVDGIITELFKVDTIDAYVNKRIKFSLNIAHDSLITKIKLDYTGESSFVKKLKKLSDITWQPKPHDFNGGPNDNWADTPQPSDYRKALGIVINAAYVSLESNLLEKHKLDSIVKNDKVTFLTIQEKEENINKLQKLKDLNIGVVSYINGTVGLGGGTTWGMLTSLYSKYYKLTTISETMGHEWGHVLGYSHNSNMTYSKKFGGRSHGFGITFSEVWNDLLTKDELPITPKNYFKPEELVWN